MKILIVCQNFYPEQFQINDIAPELVRRGHDVTVLTGLPNYPSGIVPREYCFGRHHHETIAGVNIIRCFEIGRRTGKLFLILNYLSFALAGSLGVLSLSSHYDIVLSYQLSPITMVIPAIVYSKTRHCRLLLYCLDIWPESAQAHISNKLGFFYNIIVNLSKKIYNQCDRILVTSRPFINYLVEKNGVDYNKIGYLPQHADAEYLEANLTSEDNKCVDFLYAGNLGHGQVLENIVLATELLKERQGFMVHIVGDGSCLDELKSLVRGKQLGDKIVFHGYRSRSEMAGVYRLADALLLTLRGNNYVGMTMPGKLQTYMSTGKPIFGAINGAANDTINEAMCGACVSAGDYQGLSRLMNDFIDNPQKYNACGQNARKYFSDHFTLEKYIYALELEMEKL